MFIYTLQKVNAMAVWQNLEWNDLKCSLHGGEKVNSLCCLFVLTADDYWSFAFSIWICTGRRYALSCYDLFNFIQILGV